MEHATCPVCGTKGLLRLYYTKHGERRRCNTCDSDYSESELDKMYASEENSVNTLRCMNANLAREIDYLKAQVAAYKGRTEKFEGMRDRWGRAFRGRLEAQRWYWEKWLSEDLVCLKVILNPKLKVIENLWSTWPEHCDWPSYQKQEAKGKS